jgi:hypothetical protein
MLLKILLNANKEFNDNSFRFFQLKELEKAINYNDLLSIYYILSSQDLLKLDLVDTSIKNIIIELCKKDMDSIIANSDNISILPNLYYDTRILKLLRAEYKFPVNLLDINVTINTDIEVFKSPND